MVKIQASILLAALFCLLALSLPTKKDKANWVNKDLHVDSADFAITFTVTETYLVFISGPCTVQFLESFCNGRSFTVYDNGILMTTVETGAPKYCGINTSSYVPIVAPTFGEYNMDILTGFHNITVVTLESPLLDRTSSLRVTFFPGTGSKINMLGTARRSART
ncbi:hypothetical protein PSACC_03751 [Paramicrosporidium saccamoebae]|uniref:Uncharacterized protein n=1 Tax=Paramicrosporidium saccamoebae TaxID=1246581 RepID=A0A2H9TFE5_9FUNG|nr:hypothetical protein PSACC_03751 [Paramicrosporidium saccamoebae]